MAYGFKITNFMALPKREAGAIRGVYQIRCASPSKAGSHPNVALYLLHRQPLSGGGPTVQGSGFSGLWFRVLGYWVYGFGVQGLMVLRV